MADKGTISVGMILALVIAASLFISRSSLAQCMALITGLNDISIPETAFSYNSTTEELEASASDPFQVIIFCQRGARAQSGSVNITGVTCPITGEMQPGSPAGYLSADLSRYDLELPRSSTHATKVALTVWLKVPLTVPAGSYSGGSVEITATIAF